MNIAIIPARGGSKRIPRKNIKLFAGKPMIAYAIMAAKESGLFQHILVSSDDPEIIEISRQWGAETPFIRPPELADDYTTTMPVVTHAINECTSLGWRFDKVCCIYPSVPFIKVEDLKSGLELLKSASVPFIFPVTEFPTALQRAIKLDENGYTSALYPENELLRTQDFEPTFYDAGQFCWGAKEAWLRFRQVHSNGVGLIIPKWRVVDIDTIDDWLRAELVWEIFKKMESSNE
jgi:pseudaminic acid cytidylyltransferase